MVLALAAGKIIIFIGLDFNSFIKKSFSLENQMAVCILFQVKFSLLYSFVRRFSREVPSFALTFCISFLVDLIPSKNEFIYAFNLLKRAWRAFAAAKCAVEVGVEFDGTTAAEVSKLSTVKSISMRTS